MPAIAVEHGDVVTLKPTWTKLGQGEGTLHVRKPTGVESTRPMR
jgi:hypothetical protein